MDAGRDLTSQDFQISIRPHGNDDWSAFPEASAKSTDNWDAFPEVGAVTASGLAKQGGVGVAKGAIGIAGMPGDAQSLAASTGTSDYLSRKFEENFPDAAAFLKSETAKTMKGPVAQGAAQGGDIPGNVPLPTSSDIQGQVEKATGPFREPQNQAETDAQTVGEFVPAALAGPGGVVRKLFTQAAVPAAATITAGRYSNQNPYVKALAGFLAGGAMAGFAQPGSVEKILRAQLPEFVTEQHITRAGNLIQHAAQRGVTLTWPEALSRVTGQPVLTDTQRILESHPQTRTQMQTFMADRPAQVEGAVAHELDYLGTPSRAPANIGPQVAQTAENTIHGIRAAINRATRPSYDAAAQTLVPVQIHAAMISDPLFEHTLRHVRNDPALNSFVGVHSDRSVAVYDAVAKELEQRARNAAQPTNPNASQAVASATGTLAQQVKNIGVRADRNAVGPFQNPPPPGVGNYEHALAEQTRLRETYLNPILHGPLGKLADAPDTKRAISIMFDANPVPGSQHQIGDAVAAIAHRRPAAAEQLVRAHAEMVFNEAARDLQSGANQFSGAKFVVKLTGNAQQRENLRAAVEALPNGQARWQGLEELLDVLAATGQRQPKGSLTAFNALEAGQMSGSGLAALAAKGASPGKYMTLAHDAYKAWSMGRNLDTLARIITNPNAGNAFRAISRIPPGAERVQALAGRLIMTLGASTTEQRKAAN